jgi:hypothetical protein
LGRIREPETSLRTLFHDRLLGDVQIAAGSLWLDDEIQPETGKNQGERGETEGLLARNRQYWQGRERAERWTVEANAERWVDAWSAALSTRAGTLAR